VAWLIAQHVNASVARAWFQGLNPQLDDRSAARLLREGELDEVGPQLLSAARPSGIAGTIDRGLPGSRWVEQPARRVHGSPPPASDPTRTSSKL